MIRQRKGVFEALLPAHAYPLGTARPWCSSGLLGLNGNWKRDETNRKWRLADVGQEQERSYDSDRNCQICAEDRSKSCGSANRTFSFGRWIDLLRRLERRPTPLLGWVLKRHSSF